MCIHACAHFQWNIRKIIIISSFIPLLQLALKRIDELTLKLDIYFPSSKRAGEISMSYYLF
jgi:hypothetical protein